MLGILSDTFIHIILEREEGMDSNLKNIMEIHTYAYSPGKILKCMVCEGGVGLVQRDMCTLHVHFERAHSHNLGCSCSMSLRHQRDSLWAVCAKALLRDLENGRHACLCHRQ